MEIDIITLFPEVFSGVFEHSIIKRAQDNKIINISLHQLRDFTNDKHRTVDDTPYGGGAGMVFKPEPLFKAVKHIQKKGGKVIYPSPRGKIFTHKLAQDLTESAQLVFICGRYEGIDQRVVDQLVDYEISIGDYVLSGGELPAMIMIDTIARLIPGVVGKYESVENDSFFHGTLDHPHYTKPADFQGYKVPEVLLSGNHQEIEKWRRKQKF